MLPVFQQEQHWYWRHVPQMLRKKEARESCDPGQAKSGVMAALVSAAFLVQGLSYVSSFRFD